MSVVKYVVTGVVSAAVSGTTAWYITKKYYEKKASETINAALEQINNHKEAKKEKEPEPTNDISTEVTEKNKMPTYVDIIKKSGYINPDYNSAPNIPEKKKPYKVDIDMWEVPNGYAKISLLWYTDDEVLATEDDVIIDDIDYTLGDFTDNFDEDGYQYILNENNDTIYEVLKCEKSYHEEVTVYPVDIPEED